MGTHLRNLIVSLILCIGSVTAVCAQTFLVRGKVLDSRGAPLSKVSISVKLNNAKHTTTDKEGKFSLEVAEHATLIFTLTGKKITEATATKSPLEIILEDSDEQQKGATVTTMPSSITARSTSKIIPSKVALFTFVRRSYAIQTGSRNYSSTASVTSIPSHSPQEDKYRTSTLL